jgi:hypothetical protein
MNVIRLTATAGADRTLHLAVPVETAGGEYGVAVVLSPMKGTGTSESIQYPGWPAGYVESTFGSIQDETFVRHPQPVFPPAKVLD